MKIAYIGIDILIGTLTELINNGCQIMEIFTCKTDNKTEFNTRVRTKAKELNIPCSLEPVSLTDLKRLHENGCEAVFCAGYYHKLPVLPGLPMINIHPSPLPVGRGAWPGPVTILKGLKTSGVTFHKITEEWDKGDILMQEEFALEQKENLSTLTKKVQTSICHMLPLLLSDFYTYYHQAYEQGEGEYWPCPEPRDWTITSKMEPDTLERILRAFYGYECLLLYEDKKYEVLYGRFETKKPGHGSFLPVRGGYMAAERIQELNRCMG